MVQISEVKGIPSKYPILTAGTARENRVAAHSHIKGLGLRDDGLADPTAGGFIGQTQAREVRFFALLAALSREYGLMIGLWCGC
jgi:RuvB-like protein 1